MINVVCGGFGIALLTP
ncbi:hypothetical protein L2680_00190 [Shewanella gelidii]|nr:hypothetical protein [Shewanella gelidii]